MLKGIVTTMYKSADGKTDYSLMKEHGFDTADFQGLTEPFYPLHTMGEDNMLKALRREREDAEKAGIQIFQVHCCEPEYDGSFLCSVSNMDDIKRCVRASAYLGSRYLAVHPVMPYGWGAEEDENLVYEKNTAFFEELCAYAKELDVDICLENMPFEGHFLARIPDILKFVVGMNKDNLYICLDTGHCNVFADDCGDMIRLCADKLKILHVHDNNGRCDEHRFPYQGSIDWNKFSNALHEMRFDGSVSLEYDISKKCRGDVLELMRIFSSCLAGMLI